MPSNSIVLLPYEQMRVVFELIYDKSINGSYQAIAFITEQMYSIRDVYMVELDEKNQRTSRVFVNDKTKSAFFWMMAYVKSKFYQFFLLFFYQHL